VEAYPAVCVEIERKSPRFVTEIGCVCELNNGRKRIVNIKLFCLLVILNVFSERDVVKLCNNHPVILAVIHSVKPYSIEMIINIYIGEIPENFKRQMVCNKPIHSTTKSRNILNRVS
jgi:hypothetical protein